MINAIEILSSELASMQRQIRDDHGNDSGLIDKQNQVKEAIKWLTQLQKLGIEWRETRIIKLKDIGYCDYRLLIDDETDNRDSWTEVSLDDEDKRLKLGSGDILIVKK